MLFRWDDVEFVCSGYIQISNHKYCMGVNDIKYNYIPDGIVATTVDYTIRSKFIESYYFITNRAI